MSKIQSSRQKTGRTDYQCVFCLKLTNFGGVDKELTKMVFDVGKLEKPNSHEAEKNSNPAEIERCRW